MIIKKILRLVVRQPAFLMRVLIIFIFLVVIVSEILVSWSQSQQYAKAKQELALVKSIPDMEKKIRPSSISANSSPVLVKESIVLEGTSIQNGIPYALIGGVIYQTGDNVGDYRITDIQRGSVTLEDSSTHGKKFLSLPE